MAGSESSLEVRSLGISGGRVKYKKKTKTKLRSRASEKHRVISFRVRETGGLGRQFPSGQNKLCCLLVTVRRGV